MSTINRNFLSWVKIMPQSKKMEALKDTGCELKLVNPSINTEKKLEPTKTRLCTADKGKL